MKKFFNLLPIILCFFKVSEAKDKYADGFYISNSGDTTACSIRMPINLGTFNEIELFFSVTILDSANRKVKFKPGQIKGYGFIYRSKKYIYISKVVDDENHAVFVWPMEMGKRVNEYYYYTSNAHDPGKGGMGGMEEVYVLENDAHEVIAITQGGSLINGYKGQLRKFFEEDKPVLRLIPDIVKEFHDITKLVKAANEF